MKVQHSAAVALPRAAAFFFAFDATTLGRLLSRESMRTALLTLLSLALPGAALADSMRCDKWVVSETATVTELVEKCGEPVSKEVTTEDVVVRNTSSYGVRKIGETVIERWRYQHGTQSLPMLVTIVDGKIQSIERTE
jgi:hypothetical protein